MKPGFSDEALPHLDAVYRFALRLTASADEAEDLVQETFLRAFRSWEQYTPGTRVKSWLFTICRNVFLRGVERASRAQEILAENVDYSSATEPDIENPLWATVAGEDPEGAFFGSIVDARILAAIEALPDEFRVAIALSDIEGLSYAEISALLDLPVGTVKSRLFRGRRRLQELLFEYAVEAGIVSAAASGEGAA